MKIESADTERPPQPGPTPTALRVVAELEPATTEPEVKQDLSPAASEAPVATDGTTKESGVAATTQVP